MIDSNKNLTRTSVRIASPTDGRDPDDLLRTAYAIMTDVAHYPEYMPSVEALKILAQNENQLMTRWDAHIDGAPVRWVQIITCLETQREMHFEATEGDFDVFRGQWAVSVSEGQIKLQLTIEYRIGIPVIEAVLGPVLKEKVDANAKAMLEAIVDRLKVQA
jgi:ribosome-associated toxin RatA of RatAB toxin-antitoxin module